MQNADSKELFIILPQTSHRFQSNEVPFFKVNIRIFEHKVKPFCEWIWCLGFISALWWRPPRVQMEYSQKNEYFPFKTAIIDDSLQNTLGKKMPSVIWKLLISLHTGTAIILSFMKLATYFSYKYSIWTRGGRHQKALMNPKHQIHS